MPRKLDTTTLDGAAEFYATEFLRPSRWSPRDGRIALGGRDWVVQCLYNAHFMDEHDYLVEQVKAWMGSKALVEFEKVQKEVFEPRDGALFQRLLAEKLAVDPDGNHVDGVVGTIEVGVRVVGREARLRRTPVCKPVEPGKIDGEWYIADYRESMKSAPIYWPVYAGEGEERVAGRIKASVGAPGPGVDPLPPGTEPLPVGANVTNISAESCIAALDTMTIRLEEGTTAATIRGRTGAQPADPDAVETGTLLFTLTCTDPGTIAAAVDDADGTCSATFAAITDDSAADATGTLGYCRFGATGTGADDHIDGNATTDGTGATDWNTLSIVSGSTVSMTSAVLGMSQGSTAS